MSAPAPRDGALDGFPLALAAQIADAKPMPFEEAVLDAARTVALLKQRGALARDIGADLFCAPTWPTIEMEIRSRNLTAHLTRRWVAENRALRLRPAAA